MVSLAHTVHHVACSFSPADPLHAAEAPQWPQVVPTSRHEPGATKGLHSRWQRGGGVGVRCRTTLIDRAHQQALLAGCCNRQRMRGLPGRGRSTQEFLLKRRTVVVMVTTERHNHRSC